MLREKRSSAKLNGSKSTSHVTVLCITVGYMIFLTLIIMRNRAMVWEACESACQLEHSQKSRNGFMSQIYRRSNDVP